MVSITVVLDIVGFMNVGIAFKVSLIHSDFRNLGFSRLKRRGLGFYVKDFQVLGGVVGFWF